MGSLWNTKIEGSHYRFFNTMPLNGAKDMEYMALQFMTEQEIHCKLDDKDLLQQIEDFGEIGDKLFENIAGHLGIDKDDDSDRVNIFMTTVRNMFTKKMDVWWATNTPKD